MFIQLPAIFILNKKGVRFFTNSFLSKTNLLCVLFMRLADFMIRIIPNNVINTIFNISK